MNRILTNDESDALMVEVWNKVAKKYGLKPAPGNWRSPFRCDKPKRREKAKRSGH